MNHFFKNNPFLVFYMVGSFAVVSLLAQGKLVSALLIIVLVVVLCLYLNHIKDKK